MVQRILSFLLIVGLGVNAQIAIDLNGTVKNKSGSPINNANVALAKKGLTATTGTDGKYVIKSVSTIPLFQPQGQNITLKGTFLEFSLENPSPVRVEIFDVNGNLLHKELQNGQKGFYSFNIAENFQATKLLVIHASIGQQEMIFRYVPMSSGKYMLSAKKTLRRGSKLKKLADVVNDTLKVTATNYEPQSFAITRYDTTVDFTLDTVAPENTATVNLGKTKQLIRGFGINNTWGSLTSQNAIDKCFNKETGLGLNVLRIGMQPDGSPYESYDDIKNARNLGCEYFIGTVWTAPGSWKSNGSENDGGSLNKDKYNDWADRIAAFPAKVKNGSGVDLYAMSPQNETDFASCGMSEPCNGNYQTMLWNGKDYAEFFAIAGPKIKAAGCKTMAPEASEWLHAWSDFSACCTEPGGLGSSDPLGCGFLGQDETPKCDSTKGYNYGRWLYRNATAWNAVDIFSTHQYDTQVAEPWPDDVPKDNENGRIEVWQTEMSGVKWWPEQGNGTGNNLTCNSTIQNGVAVARWIQNALTVGEASAWCYWWWTHLSSGTNDNEGITCQGTLTKRYYTFGNFSRYMRPGMTVVEITGQSFIPEKVLLVAAKDDDGKVVIIAINETNSEVTLPITISGGTAPSSFKPIVTSESDNWAEKSAVTVSDGVLTAILEKMSVTTFVSE